MAGSDNSIRQFLRRFGFSHYDLDSILMMNVYFCRILFGGEIAEGHS